MKFLANSIQNVSGTGKEKVIPMVATHFVQMQVMQREYRFFQFLELWPHNQL